MFFNGQCACFYGELTPTFIQSFSSEESYLEELVSNILLGMSLFFLLLTLAAIIPNKYCYLNTNNLPSVNPTAHDVGNQLLFQFWADLS